MQEIDFVVLWVDGNDPAWQADKARFSATKDTDVRPNRYRDWDNLQYWFRGVEKFAPWVRTIHFVTWGHLPPWLDVSNPKLHVVNHRDFIPNECLPTFNTNPIELNIHRIPGLSEGFVYFNDDMFLTAPVSPEDFVQDGKPVERLLFDAIAPGNETLNAILYNNMKCINHYFAKEDLKKNHRKELFSLRYGKGLIFNLLLYPWKRHTGFHSEHLPLYFTKSTYEEVWAREEGLLYETTTHKFRSESDVSAWLMRYWSLAQGNIVPASAGRGRYISATEAPIEAVTGMIQSGKYKMICCNDTCDCPDFEERKQKVLQAFDYLLPERSSYELPEGGQ